MQQQKDAQLPSTRVKAFRRNEQQIFWSGLWSKDIFGPGLGPNWTTYQLCDLRQFIQLP